MNFIENLVHASDGIIASVLYLFICLVTIMWLLVVYFNKKRKNSIRAVFFKIILFTIILLLVSNGVVVFFINEGVDGIIFRIAYAIHWECFIWWFGTYRVYNLLFLSNTGEEEWPKKGGWKKLYTELPISRKIVWNDIVKYMAMIVYLFLPFTMPDKSNLIFIQGINTYFVILYMFVSAGISLGETLITYNKQTLFNKSSVIFVYAVMGVAILCQYLIKDTTVYCLCAAIQVYFLYFMVENPDIRLRKEIEELKTGIEKSNRAKTDFLSNMSHEIRTPMNAIVGFSDSLLTNTNFDVKTARGDIENIYTAGNNLVDIINNILDVSKIESEQNTINAKNCNIDKIVKELASVIKSRLGKKPIEFITELDEHIPSVVWGDSTKIYQILLNIANNSVKYTEVGKIKLSCIPETLDNKQVLLHFRITDTGYGIKKEDYDKVFKKYSRLEDATDNNIEGTGLGLVITKQFVELMGGKIWFTSDFEVGTTFYIDIPFKVIDETPIGVQKDITSEKTEDGYIRHLDCSDYTVLIVDDNETNLKVASRLLEKYKFKIETAKNGKDCVYKFKYGNKYDMILLDDMMPEMDGVDTVKIIKKLDVFDIPPIVAFTANAMTGMGEKYLAAGFDYYLPMPVSIQELDELVKTYFGEKVKTYVEDKEEFMSKESSTEKKDNEESTKKVEKAEEKKEEVKEESKEEEKAEETPVEEKKEETEAKEEVKEEPKAEEKSEETPAEEKKEESKTKEEVKEESKEEEKTEEAPVEEKKEETEAKEEVKEESKEEEKTEEAPAEEKKEESETKEEVKEESKEEEKPEEAPSEEKKEESEVKEEVKEEPKKEEKTEEAPVEEKKEETEVKEEVKEESKEEEKPEEAPSEEKKEESETKEEVKEESKEEEKTEEVPVEEKKEESEPEPEAKEEVKEEPKEEVKTEEAPAEEKKEESESTEKVEKDETKSSEESTTSKIDDIEAEEKFLRDKGVDMDKALEFLMDMEMYNMTINDFLAGIDEKWANINKYKQDGDMPKYAIEVHSLKSDCKYLGFMKLADVAYEHELKSKENNSEFVNQNFDKLEKEYNDAMAIIKEYTNKYDIKSE